MLNITIAPLIHPVSFFHSFFLFLSICACVCAFLRAGKPCGVDYELKAFVGDHIEDKPHKRNSVRLAIRKIMYAPSKLGEQPSIEVSKEFMMKPNKIHLEASLDKEVNEITNNF